MMRDEAVKEIKRMGSEHNIPLIFFEETAGMKELLDDMRLGANIRLGFKEAGRVLEDEFYKRLLM
ncbi:MAG: hypothetical protein HZB80_11390 [Deltaproteobacteria bacterium]|nr:hypothetical protein [Deltaproteobacteria bacterium]